MLKQWVFKNCHVLLLNESVHSINNVNSDPEGKKRKYNSKENKKKHMWKVVIIAYMWPEKCIWSKDVAAIE